MANKKGYWYTGIYEGYRYKIKNNFTANEWKLVQYTLDLLTEDDIRRAKRKLNKDFSFSSDQLYEFFGVNQKTKSEEIEKLLESFVQRTVWRVSVDEPNGSYDAIVVMQKMAFKDNVFVFSINHLAIPYLFFQKMNLDHKGFQYYFKFTSSYSGVLYSLIKKSLTPNECTLKIEDLRMIFGATSKSYADLRNFKVRILNPAVKDISRISDIKLTYAEQKTTRRTEAILFSW